MYYPIHIHTLNNYGIVHFLFKGVAVQNFYKIIWHFIMQHFTVCQRTCLLVSIMKND